MTPADVLRVFAADSKPDNFGFYRVPCQLGECELSMTIENGVATGVTILRPCAGTDLLERLLNLLRTGPYVAFAPGSKLVAVDGRAAQYMPAEMREAIGPVCVVSNTEQLSDALFAA